MVMPGDDVGEAEGVPRSHTALLTLHELAGTYDEAGELPGFARSDLGDALADLAEAPEDEASEGLKLDTLVALAHADFPGHDRFEDRYEQLARAIGAPYGLDAELVLDDAKAIGRGDAHVSETVTGQRLPHGATAFVGEDVCAIHDVVVDGKPAVWVYSEFETDAPFGGVSDWVNPVNWPRRGPAMFKRMDVVGGRPTPIPGGPGLDHWHGVYHEEVQLLERMNTLLHCDYYSTPNAATGMTYLLDHSIDGKLVVDRGFLLVTDAGPVRRVKALKIVAFTDPDFNVLAKMVCPFWTDFVRQAAVGGRVSTPATPEAPGGAPGGDTAGWLGDWTEFAGEAAKVYSSLVGDTVDKLVAGTYGRQELMDDGFAYWTQLAKDWATAWRYASEMIEAVADQGLVAPRPPGKEDEAGSTFAPCGPARESVQRKAGQARSVAPAGAAAAQQPAYVESVIVPIEGLRVDTAVDCGDFVGIEAGRPVIGKDAIRLSVVEIAPQVHGVRVDADAAKAAPGLYVGAIELGPNEVVQAELYVSKARRNP